MTTWDWIVVGGGSAGCTIAARLSELPGASVLLLEAGPATRPLSTRVPAAFNTLFRGDCDWAFETAPEPRLNRRRMFWPRGKLLGGSSAINAMIWTRGHEGDFTRWQARGCAGWGWNDVKPWFERSAIRPTQLRRPTPVSNAFMEAMSWLGHRRNDGFDSGNEGAGYFGLSVRGGERESTARAYLDRARGRPGLDIRGGVQVSRIRFDDGRATGVEVATGASTSERLRARKGVVLSAGAIGTPVLLQRSGVGPAQDLRKLGIPCLVDRPEVGGNLCDHLAVGIAHHCLLPVTLDSARGLLPLSQWLLLRRGPLTSNVAEAGAFLRTDPSLIVPDLEILIGSAWFVDHGFRTFPGAGFTVAAVGVTPHSRGRIRLAGAHAATPPIIEPNYLADERDLLVLIQGLKVARQIVSAPAFDRYRGPEALPGPAAQTDDQLAAHIRQESQTLYHPAGTCRMGSDADAVVDPSLRVRGVAGLWAADASVMPELVSTHPNATVVMIGERAASLITSNGSD